MRASVVFYVLLGHALLVCAAENESAEALRRCGSCHRAETAAYLQSAMGRSLQSTAPGLPSGTVRHAASSSTVSAYVGADRSLSHTLRTGGAESKYPVRYAVGAGIVGFSFLVQVGDGLLQSPLSFYSRPGRWDLTPGYENERALDFTHRVSEGCAFCHTGRANLKAGTEDHFEGPEPLTPISCDRCHGSAERHLASPGRGTIENPAKLQGAARDSICEQCHLEGDARVLNPGKRWFDFKVGQETETVFTTYLIGGKTRGLRAVSQSELLAQSRCATESGGKLWCGTCHDPHKTKQSQAAAYTRACLTCHAAVQARSWHPTGDNCTGCHMPKLRPTDVPHSSTTDHRILIPGKGNHARERGCADVGCLVAWREPALTLRERDIGIALFQYGANRQARDQMAASYNVLSGVYRAGSRDPAVLSTLASMLLAQNHPELAVDLYRQALQVSPGNASNLYGLGEALRHGNKPTEAAEAFRASIGSDPTAPEAYRALEKMFREAGRKEESKQVVRDYLRFMPQNIEFRRKLY